MADGPENSQRSQALVDGRKTPFLQWVIGYSIVGLFLLLCGYYVYSHREEFVFALSISPRELTAAGFFVLLAFLVSAYQFGLFLEEFGIRMGKLELVALTMAMCLGNLLVPMRGGTGASALYLKKAHGLDFTSFAVIYGGTGLLIVLINTALALLSFVVLWLVHGLFFGWLILITAAIFGLCLYLSLFPPSIRWKGRGLLGAVFQAAHSWRLLTRKRGLLARLTVSFLVVAFALAASFYFIYAALGKPMSFEGTLVTSSMGAIANLVALTPGSLGIFDAVVIQVPQTFGLDTARSVAAAILFRVVSFFWALGLGIPGILYVMRLSRRAEDAGQLPHHPIPTSDGGRESRP